MVLALETDKNLCPSCNHVCLDKDVLYAPDPFTEGAELYACPNCQDVNSLRKACDHPACKREVTCGTPTPTGYRSTCGEHMP